MQLTSNNIGQVTKIEVYEKGRDRHCVESSGAAVCPHRGKKNKKEQKASFLNVTATFDYLPLTFS